MWVATQKTESDFDTTEYYNIQYDIKHTHTAVDRHQQTRVIYVQSLHCFKLHAYTLSLHMHSLLYITEDKTSYVYCLYANQKI